MLAFLAARSMRGFGTHGPSEMTYRGLANTLGWLIRLPSMTSPSSL